MVRIIPIDIHARPPAKVPVPAQWRFPKRGNAWRYDAFKECADDWLEEQVEKRGKRTASEHDAAWWSFVHRWSENSDRIIFDLMRGAYCFSPLMRYHFKPDPGEQETIEHHPAVYTYEDKLAMRLLHRIMKPIYPHIISSRCMHLFGFGVKNTTRLIENALNTGEFNYFIRTDIKSYYASIDKDLLWEMVKRVIDDPLLLSYLKQVLNYCISDSGCFDIDPDGIPRRCSLSLFFAALYLKALDEAFDASGCFIVRYNDDICILAKSPGQFRRAKKRLAKILKSHHLSMSPTKTRMGRLNRKSFHFLGISFYAIQHPTVRYQKQWKTANTPLKKAIAIKQHNKQTTLITQNPSPQSSQPTQYALDTVIEPELLAQQKLIEQSQPEKAMLSIHSRSVRRAMDKVKILINDDVNPSKIQDYLLRWAGWWSRAIRQLNREVLLASWLALARQEGASTLMILIGEGALRRLHSK